MKKKANMFKTDGISRIEIREKKWCDFENLAPIFPL